MPLKRGRDCFRIAQKLPATTVRMGRLSTGYKFASGGMISTAEDLVRLCVALNHGRVLKPNTTENGRMIVSHDGSVKGFNACLINYPEEDVAAAVMYNAAGPPTCTEAKTLANFFLSVPSSRP